MGGVRPAVADLARRMEPQGLTLAVAESCTGGWIMKRLTDIPGSSAWLLGGVVAYHDRLKAEILGVSRSLLDTDGAVSEAVARAMAQGVRGLTGADVGGAVTGIAGPGGAVPGKPVGTVWFAVAGPRGVRSEHRRLDGDRRAVREQAVDHLVRMILRQVDADLGPAADQNPGGSRG
jgi:PncC family amidohydrolase